VVISDVEMSPITSDFDMQNYVKYNKLLTCAFPFLTFTFTISAINKKKAIYTR